MPIVNADEVTLRENEARSRRKVPVGACLMKVLHEMVESEDLLPEEAVKLREAFDTTFMKELQSVATEGMQQSVLRNTTVRVEKDVAMYQNVVSQQPVRRSDWRLDGRVRLVVSDGESTTGPTVLSTDEDCHSFIALPLNK